jgi:Tol biopolymer transport system component
VLDGVAQALTAPNTTDVSLAGQFAVASTGTLAWLPRGSAGSLPARALVAVDRQGHVSPLTAPVKSYGSRVRLAPGGRELVVIVRGVRELGLWTHDLVRGTVTPVLQDGEAACAIWTPDGQHLVFQWLKDGRHLLAWQRADGTAPPEVLAAGPLWPSSWTADGRQLAAANPDSDTLAIVTVERGRATVTPLPQAPKASWSPGFSPDGHWLAYTSDVSGREEVYVQPYPGPGPRVQVSIDGGLDPAWHKNGRRLFFVSPGTGAGKARMMEVDVQPGSPPRIGTPRPLFEFAGDLFADSVIVRAYDVTPDGQRFFVVQKRPAPPLPPVTHVNLVLNWFEELKAKVPVR